MAAAAAETQLRERVRVPGKRKFEHRKRSKPKGASTKPPGDFKGHKKVRRIRERQRAAEQGEASSSGGDGESDESEVEEEAGPGEEGSGGSGSEDDGGGEETQKGVTKFTHGCRAFKMAFTKIMKSGQADSLLGPMLSAHKKLVVKKLAEEEEEKKAKGEAKKQRHLVAERGHVKPANFLDSKEKFLMKVASRGVVRLFNGVNKARNPQKALDPSRSKDAKELAKRRREAFFSEIRKPTTAVNDSYSSFEPSKVPALTDNNKDEPGWAPLRDCYLLTGSKLKDWDKMEGPSSSAGRDIVHSESSSDEE